MLQNNPNFTETVGTVKSQMNNFDGQTETRLYTESEKSSLQNSRPVTGVQADIYNLPNNKVVFQDMGNILAQPKDSKEK